MAKQQAKKKPIRKKVTPKKVIGFGYVQDAIKSKASPEVIDELIRYEQRLAQEKRQTEFLLAKREFQNTIPVLPKDGTGVGMNGKLYHYTLLPTIIAKIQPFLYKNGFTFRWSFQPLGKQIECSFILTHTNGYSEMSSMTADLDDSADMLNNVQSAGSTRTYLQRYTIIPGLGLTTVEDDNDGASALTKKVSSIPSPEAISNEREELEKFNLEELVLRVDRLELDEFLLLKYGELKEKFTEKERSEIRTHLIDEIIKKSVVK